MTESPATGYALITGASSGIGSAFAEALAESGRDLVLVARSKQALVSRATELSTRYGVHAVPYALDLTQPGAVRELATMLSDDGFTIDFLVNNAGFGTQGRFDRIDPERDHDQVLLNVVTVVDLCHALVPGMVARGQGTVVNVGSMGGFQPAPYLAVYGATKAFILSFSQALAGEIEDTGVRVLALCPGPVMTSFFDVLGSTHAAVGQQLTAEQVVAAGLRGLKRGRRVVVPGWQNKITANAARLLPRRTMVAIAKRSVGLDIWVPPAN
ncbi:SDR family NAD(P)-dependent oxidoreductase [Nocardia sp. SYP-A9097]|uniref:SDR family NAD(P)-dependent oxidoreductase n=1 Tax=Nocardia sp. SYP-A9097 TaxID=2663237 RepID=UPI00129AC3C6|nr:SDR family oxidoreductase [Nocardia sp. SYP-A9097]MRH92359.1 SDR family NAD(P)-dependent oxidoreductase [Nocardia sp. SYP-A9097]